MLCLSNVGCCWDEFWTTEIQLAEENLVGTIYNVDKGWLVQIWWVLLKNTCISSSSCGISSKHALMNSLPPSFFHHMSFRLSSSWSPSNWSRKVQVFISEWDQVLSLVLEVGRSFHIHFTTTNFFLLFELFKRLRPLCCLYGHQ